MTTKSNFLHLALSPLRSATNDHRLTTNDKAFFHSALSPMRIATNDNRMTTNDNFLRSATNDNHNHKLNSIFHQTSTIIHFALLFALILFSTSFSQTIIKEKVEIKPQQTLETTANTFSGRHTVQAEVQWTPAQWLGFSWHSADCDGGISPDNPVDWTEGHHSATYSNVREGPIKITTAFALNCYEWPTITGRYQLYVDGVQIYNKPFTITGGWCLFGSPPRLEIKYFIPYALAADFDIYAYDVFSCPPSEQLANISISPDFKCGQGYIDTLTDKINLNITEGGEYISFLANGIKTDNVSFYYWERVKVGYQYDYDGLVIDTVKKDINIRCNWGSITKNLKFRLSPLTRVSFSIERYPVFKNISETLLYGNFYTKFCMPHFNNCKLSIIKGESIAKLRNHQGETGTTINISKSFYARQISFYLRIEDNHTIRPDTVVIRMTCDNFLVDSTDIPIIVYPNPLVVEIDPPTVAAGDTAIIRIKQLLPDRTIVEIDQDATFEVGMLEGCAAGNLLGEDCYTGEYGLSSYIYGQQPILFIASDSLKEKQNIVKVRVGWDIGYLDDVYFNSSNISNETKTKNREDHFAMINHNKIESEKIKNNLTENENILGKTNYVEEKTAINKTTTEINTNSPSPNNPVNNYCFVGEVYNPFTKDAEFLVESICDTLRPLLIDTLKNKVITVVTDLMFKVTPMADNDTIGCRRTKDLGGWASTITPPDIDQKFKNGYYYIDKIMFTLKWGFCPDRINQKFGNPIMIDIKNDSLTGIKNIAEKEDVLNDLNNMIKYNAVKKYFPIASVRVHELTHIQQYTDSLKYYYDIALKEINEVEESPSDWCETNKIEEFMEKRKEKFDESLGKAQRNFLKSHDDYNDKYEEGAKNAENDYIKNTLKPKAKDFPY